MKPHGLSMFADRLYDLLPRGKGNAIKRDTLLLQMQRTPCAEQEHAEAFMELEERGLRTAKNELENALEKVNALLGPGGCIITDYNEACEVLAYWEKHARAYENKLRRIRRVVSALKPVLPQQPWDDTPLARMVQTNRCGDMTTKGGE